MSWFTDDICWCIDSDVCDCTECFRHLSHKSPETRFFSCAKLMDTEYCPRAFEVEDYTEEF